MSDKRDSILDKQILVHTILKEDEFSMVSHMLPDAEYVQFTNDDIYIFRIEPKYLTALELSIETFNVEYRVYGNNCNPPQEIPDYADLDVMLEHGTNQMLHFICINLNKVVGRIGPKSLKHFDRIGKFTEAITKYIGCKYLKGGDVIAFLWEHYRDQSWFTTAIIAALKLESSDLGHLMTYNRIVIGDKLFKGLKLMIDKAAKLRQIEAAEMLKQQEVAKREDGYIILSLKCSSGDVDLIADMTTFKPHRYVERYLMKVPWMYDQFVKVCLECCNIEYELTDGPYAWSASITLPALNWWSVELLCQRGVQPVLEIIAEDMKHYRSIINKRVIGFVKNEALRKRLEDEFNACTRVIYSV